MECFQTALGVSCMNRASVFEWYMRFKEGRSLWGMMRGVPGVRESIHLCWLAKRLGLGLPCWGFREYRKRFRRKKPAPFKSGQCISTRTMHQSTIPLLSQSIWPRWASRQFLPLPIVQTLFPDFCLFPKLRGCRRYETIEKMKEAVTKVIDTFTQEDFHGAFQKLLERYNKCIAFRGEYFEGD